MQFRCEIEGEPYQVDLEFEAGGRGTARVGDRVYRFDHLGGHLLLDGTSLDYDCWPEPGSGRFGVALPGRPHRSIQRRTPGGARKADQAGNGAVLAPMNGQVVKLLKAPGAQVEAGEVVLVLEAMKMENEVAAPVEGHLSEIAVGEGQTVNPGTLLFRIEPPNHSGTGSQRSEDL
ncbi:MAG: biotin/lipoyl-binding protein [Armatimonadetes bacterium]|nr:biotin/lipoyl-binding protein [Armatimonadota bacterium]